MRTTIFVSAIAVILVIGLVVFKSATARDVAINNPQDVTLDLILDNVVNPGAELLLLKDLSPVNIKVAMKNPYREQGLKIKKEIFHWSASAGRLLKNEGQDNKWFPPKFSSTAAVKVEFYGEYSSGGLPFVTAKTRVEKQVGLKLLSPTSVKQLKQGKLEGYNIGEYPDPRDKSVWSKYKNISKWVRIFPEKYKPPAFFYKVSQENRYLLISPHFQLEQFILDFPWFSLGMPQYIAFDYGLVKKLEALIELMNQESFNLKTLELIYGFRPPSFNITDIEDNPESTLKVPFSLHMYGKAADVIIDRDKNLILDDLNKDGRTDIKDAAIVLKYVNQLDRTYLETGSGLVGGAGVYSRHDFQGRVQSPYIHVDIRGFTGSDGSPIRWRIEE